ncbi:unnamed protein product, partial [marine sediment metagenome]
MEKVKSGTRLKGVFEVECYRKGKLIWVEKVENIITNEGLNHILDSVLHGAGENIATWY